MKNVRIRIRDEKMFGFGSEMEKCSDPQHWYSKAYKVPVPGTGTEVPAIIAVPYTVPTGGNVCAKHVVKMKILILVHIIPVSVPY
jgi:hypothetical protein